MRYRPLFRFPWRSSARIRADLDAELEFHFQMRTEELVRLGLNAKDARAEAEREFGNQAYTRRYCEELDRAGERATRLTDWGSELRQDVRLAVRGIRRRPAYSAVVVLTLALGIGANTAAFSVLDSVLLRRMPFARADRLVTVDELNVQTNVARSDITAGEYLDWVRAQHSFEGIAVHGGRSLTFTGGAAPVLLHGRRVSANLFDVLGVRPALGRTFRPGEDASLNRLVVLSDGIWRQLFGADSEIIGRQVILGGESHSIVGVLPPDFVFPGLGRRDFYIPIDFATAMADPNRARKMHTFHGFARLKDGVSIDAARAEMTSIARAIERQDPAVAQGHLVTVLPLTDALVGEARPTILALMGAAGFVLLIAAVNLANLALARALLRRPEFAVRAALGAGRGRLIRLALTESLSLAVIGGAIGVAIAWFGTSSVLRLYPGALPAGTNVSMSVSALAFAVVTTVLVGIVFGLAPALSLRTRELVVSLRDGARGSSVGRTRARGRSVLVAAQVALAMVLVVGASLLVQTVARLQALDLGFEPTNVSTVWLSLSGPKYRERAAIVAFWSALQDRLRTEPSIESVGLSGAAPLTGGSGAGLAIQGRANPEPLPPIRYGVFSDGTLETIGVALRAGRDFSRDDMAGTNPVVLINEAAAKKFWPGQNPIGARIRLGPDPTVPWAEVIGVIADYRQEQLDAEPPALAVQNFRQDVWSSMYVTMKSREPASALQAKLAKIVSELDPALAVSEPTPLSRFVGAELGRRRFAMSILTGFGAIALLLALVGVYGVISYGVTARRQEFGVRIALGAVPSQLAASVLRHGATLAISGLVLGAIAAMLLTRFLSNLLFGVEPLDLTTFVGTAVALCVATLVACWLPARRAANADPMMVLREE